MATPENTDKANDTNILSFPAVDKTRLIATMPTDELSDEIMKIGESPDRDQAINDILKVVEQTLPGKRKAAVLAAATAFGKMEKSAAATALSGLFFKTALGEGGAYKENQRLISNQLRRVGTPEALLRLKAVVAPHAPETAVSAIARFNAPEVPEIIASIAVAQSAQGRLTGLQPLALALLTKLHKGAREGLNSLSADSVKASANRLAEAIASTLEQSLEGGEQYRKNVLDYREASALVPEMSDVSQLIEAFRHAKSQQAIIWPVPKILEKTPVLGHFLD